LAILDNDALLELECHHNDDGNNETHDQGQWHIDVEHETHRGDDVKDAPGRIKDAPRNQLG
jgi:hypothetical protein